MELQAKVIEQMIITKGIYSLKFYAYTLQCSEDLITLVLPAKDSICFTKIPIWPQQIISYKAPISDNIGFLELKDNHHVKLPSFVRIPITFMCRFRQIVRTGEYSVNFYVENGIYCKE